MKKILVAIIGIILLYSVVAQTTTLRQQEEHRIGVNRITVVDVNNDGTICGVNVNGEIKWIREGEEEYFYNVYVKVLDAIAVNAANQDKDTCQLIVSVVKGREPCPTCLAAEEDNITVKEVVVSETEGNKSTKKTYENKTLDDEKKLVPPVNETEKIQPITENKTFIQKVWSLLNSLKNILNVG